MRSWHTHLSAAENVQVEVEDLLPGVGTVVYPDGVAALGHPELRRDLAGNLEEPLRYPVRQLGVMGGRPAQPRGYCVDDQQHYLS